MSDSKVITKSLSSQTPKVVFETLYKYLEANDWSKFEVLINEYKDDKSLLNQVLNKQNHETGFNLLTGAIYWDQIDIVKLLLTLNVMFPLYSIAMYVRYH